MKRVVKQIAFIGQKIFSVHVLLTTNYLLFQVISLQSDIHCLSVSVEDFLNNRISNNCLSLVR